MVLDYVHRPAVREDSRVSLWEIVAVPQYTGQGRNRLTLKTMEEEIWDVADQVLAAAEYDEAEERMREEMEETLYSVWATCH